MIRQKTCSICGRTLPVSEFHRRRHYVRSGYRAACKRCTSLEARQARERRPPERDRKKERVRAKTRALIELGQLSPGTCKVCGATDVQAHHPDYDAPNAHLEVEWLCVKHHAQEHGTRGWTKQISLFE